MRRRTFDFILSSVGALLTVVLLVAGGLAIWGYSFADSNVHDQLAAQKIYFPAKGSSALASSEIGPYLNQYAGQELLTGAQAKAYADHFIAVHLSEIGGGKTYSELSSQLNALQASEPTTYATDPNYVKLSGTVETVFKGTTLRGMLLNAYAFWQIGQIAFWAAIASFIGAAIMLILTILGFRHLRKTGDDVDLLPARHAPPAAVAA